MRGLIPEDLLKFSWLEEIALAPDGQCVAYSVRRPDAARNGYQVDVYLLDLETHVHHKLTISTGQGHSLAWRRDGQELAYVWQGQEQTRVVIVDAEGAPQRDYVIPGAPPSGLDWSPDGQRLALVRWTPVRHPEERGPRPGIPAPTLRVIRRLRYKLNGAGWVEDRYQHIWSLDLQTGDLTQLTDGECDYGAPRWSWDGTRLACTATAREQDTPLGQGQVVIYDLNSGELARLMPHWHGAAISPQWRRDDGAIAFAGYQGDPPVNRRMFYHVWLYDLQDGQARELTGDLDQTVGNYAVADQRAGLTNITIKWPGGQGPIFFLLTDQGATHLYCVSPAAKAGAAQWQRLVGGHGVTFEYAPALSGAVAYGRATPTCIGELFLLKDGQAEQLTHLNPWLDSRQLSPPQEYHYEGLDGAQVHAWEIAPLDMLGAGSLDMLGTTPLNFQEGKRYPTIVYVHCSMFSWDFNHEFQCLANAGYVVVYFNQRGTTAGYGQAWTRASEGDQGGKDYEEIMLGVDDLIQRPYVDPERLGVTGGSCGGFMTNWIVGHTERFAAAVTQRSISNEVSQFGTSDIGPECTERETGHNPWTDMEAVWRQSPIAYAADIHTPLLIIHSDEDHRCPLEQAEQLFAALRWMGRPVELVIFLGENHGLSRGGRPGNRIERQRRILGWFQKYLEPPAA